MRTIVHQSFRTHNVPAWIERCLASGREWAAAQGYEYRFIDDRLTDYVGQDFCVRVRHNWQAIANLARLELAREALRGGYQCVIWLDADVIVFDPERLAIDLASGYAFCLQVWTGVRPDGSVFAQRSVNNCICVFTPDAADLDMLVSLTRHIVAHRQIKSNLTIGTYLLQGLQPILGFPLCTGVGLFSPLVVRGLAAGETRYVEVQTQAFGFPVYAANLGASSQGEIVEADYMKAIDVLLASRGDVVNRHLRADQRQPDR
jgi:hypothetical protein